MNLEGKIELRYSCRDQTQTDEAFFEHCDMSGIKELNEVFSSVAIQWKDIAFTAKIDWSELQSIIKESYDESGRFYMLHENTLYKQMSPVETISIPISLENVCDIEIRTVTLAFKKHLMDIFLITNLAVPGLINLSSAKLFIGDKEDGLNLSNFYFERSIENKYISKCIFSSVYPVNQSRIWYWKIEKNMSLVASDAIQKTIYSLLHICRMDADISMVPWIFHALEAIYGTNAGRGFNDLSSKINFLLEIEERERKKLKKQLRELNNLRSSFVHGGYRVSHPLADEISSDIFELTEFGVTLIICSLQKLMSNNWFGLRTEEKYLGISEGNRAI